MSDAPIDAGDEPVALVRDEIIKRVAETAVQYRWRSIGFRYVPERAAWEYFDEHSS